MDFHQFSKTLTENQTRDDLYEHDGQRSKLLGIKSASSMPINAALALLRQAHYLAGTAAQESSVIDPACGSGSSLAAAAQILIARGKARRWGAERIAQEIEKSIWGLDPDPIACHIAELRLRRTIAQLLPDLPAARRKTMQFHIHQADSLAVMAGARFRIVLTNPPIKISKAVWDAETAPTKPARDIWLQYCEQAMELTAYGGYLAIALPEVFLLKSSAAALRQTLRREWTVLAMTHTQGLFRSGASAILMTAQRSDPPAAHAISWERVEKIAALKSAESSADTGSGAARYLRQEWKIKGSIEQDLLGEGSQQQWKYALGSEERLFIERFRSRGSASFALLADIARGVEIPKETAVSETAYAGSIAVIRSGDIKPYQILPRQWISATDAATLQPNMSVNAIYITRTGAVPAAAQSSGAMIAHNSLYVAIPKADTTLPANCWPALPVLLNAKPVQLLFRLTATVYQLSRPSIDAAMLAALPLPIEDTARLQTIAALTTELTQVYQQNNSAIEALQTIRARLDSETAALFAFTAAETALFERWRITSELF